MNWSINGNNHGWQIINMNMIYFWKGGKSFEVFAQMRPDIILNDPSGHSAENEL